jgi:small GTP-binding protein
MVDFDDEDELMLKIVVIGNTATGKTNITTRYIKNEFNEGSKATIGVEFFSKTMSVHSRNIKITLWDTAGQEKYKALSKVYYKGASGILIVYSINDTQSYLDIESWMRLASTPSLLQAKMSTSTKLS